MKFKTSLERVKNTVEYLTTTDANATQSFLEIRSDNELVDPVYLLFDGEFFYCPDERCSIRGKSEEEIRNHFDVTHDSCLKDFFDNFFEEIIQKNRDRVRHEERLERLKEEIDQPVVELKEFKDKYDFGLLVCAICKESCEKVKVAKQHRKETGHNIWIRRLETNFVDPKVN